MQCKIVTAYSYSPKSVQYTVGAYVLETHHDGLPGRDTFKVLGTYVIDTDRDAAEREAIHRITHDNVRHPAGMDVEHKGRVSYERVASFTF